MCKYISWIETLDGGVHFLTDADMPRARELGIVDVDLPGHGALRLVRGWADNAPQGKEKECNDFSSPDNFPPAIAAAIREGLMTYGLPRNPHLLLTDTANAEWKRAVDTATAERKRAVDTADAKWEWAVDTADAKWKLAVAAATAERKRAVAAATAERKRILRESIWGLFANPANRTKAWR